MLFMLHKTRVAILPYHRLPEILRWYACGAEGGSGGRTEGPVGVRSRDCQIFSDGWFTSLSYTWRSALK